MYYEIDGFWVDDGAEFQGFIVKDSIEADNEELDEKVFYYFDDLQHIQHSIESGEWVDDFVVTAYRPLGTAP